MKPRIHFFEFTSENDPTKNYDLFHKLWKLDIDKEPKVDGSNEERWNGMNVGDLIVFPQLLTGAGEFESVRVVGPKVADDSSELLTILPIGIEYPEFPSVIASLAEETGSKATLRELYEEPFHEILQSSAHTQLGLIDVLGCDEHEYNEFWAKPPMQRRRGPPITEYWTISLRECIWIRTIDGETLSSKKNN
eukprot:scaffold132_cov170-Amphora_coffeaeformis.AAC.25